MFGVRVTDGKAVGIRVWVASVSVFSVFTISGRILITATIISAPPAVKNKGKLRKQDDLRFLDFSSFHKASISQWLLKKSSSCLLPFWNDFIEEALLYFCIDRII
jgi:hypothetical protein